MPACAPALDRVKEIATHREDREIKQQVRGCDGSPRISMSKGLGSVRRASMARLMRQAHRANSARSSGPTHAAHESIHQLLDRPFRSTSIRAGPDVVADITTPTREGCYICVIIDLARVEGAGMRTRLDRNSLSLR